MHIPNHLSTKIQLNARKKPFSSKDCRQITREIGDLEHKSTNNEFEAKVQAKSHWRQSYVTKNRAKITIELSNTVEWNCDGVCLGMIILSLQSALIVAVYRQSEKPDTDTNTRKRI